MIKKTQAVKVEKICCKECGDIVYQCSYCGEYLKEGENIGCSEFPDGKHYCDGCTIYYNSRKG